MSGNNNISFRTTKLINLAFICLVIFSGILFLNTAAFGQGIDFFDATWEEILAEAKKEDKLIFVDAYAVWCGPCKRMDAHVFPDPRVGSFYNANFINVKLDMERGEGIDFRRQYGVGSFPTFFFIRPDGEIAYRVSGAKPVDEFIQIGEMALRRMDDLDMLQRSFEDGNREPDFMVRYIRALKRTGEADLRIANEYLAEQEDITIPENLSFILESCSEADSRIFDLLIQHRRDIEKLYSRERVNQVIETACHATIQKALEFQLEFLLDDAKNKMKAHVPDRADEFGMRADIMFAAAMRDEKLFDRASKQFMRANRREKNPEVILFIAEQAQLGMAGKSGVMSQVESWLEDAIKANIDYNLYIALGRQQNAQGNASEAIDTLRKAIEHARSTGIQPEEAQILIRQWQRG